MSKRDKKQKEKQAMNTEEIRALREEERINSVFPEQSQSGKLINNLLVLLASLLTAAVVIVGLFYLNRLTSFMNAYALPYLWMIDDSSGFMTELLHCAIRLLFVLVICVLFGFALDINFSSVGRPKEVWQKHVNWCMLTAFGSDVLLMLISRIFGGRAAGVSGSLFSQVMYYITKLAVVPFTNIMLYLVIPSAIIKIVVTLVSNSDKKVELPLTVLTTVTLTLGMLGMSWEGVRGAGWLLSVYALIQSASYSVVYHRTNTIWKPTLLYMGVTALYYPLSYLLNLI